MADTGYVPHKLTPATEAKLRKHAHHLLMTARDYDEAHHALCVKANAIKTPDDGPQEQFDDAASWIFYNTARDTPEIRDRLISGALRDIGPADSYGPKYWQEVDLELEAKRLGLDKARRAGK